MTNQTPPNYGSHLKKEFRVGIGVVIAILALVLFAGCTSQKTVGEALGQPSHSKTHHQKTTTHQDAKPKHHATFGQRQALNRAELYLSAAGWSKKGLENQLEYDKFPHADAKYAVNHVNVDWKKQAIRSAKTYLKITGYSKAGLVAQLEFDKFTHAQAVYGANHAYKG